MEDEDELVGSNFHDLQHPLASIFISISASLNSTVPIYVYQNASPDSSHVIREGGLSCNIPNFTKVGSDLRGEQALERITNVEIFKEHPPKVENFPRLGRYCQYSLPLAKLCYLHFAQQSFLIVLLLIFQLIYIRSDTWQLTSKQAAISSKNVGKQVSMVVGW